jgi:hypothetical protein
MAGILAPTPDECYGGEGNALQGTARDQKGMQLLGFAIEHVVNARIVVSTREDRQGLLVHARIAPMRGSLQLSCGCRVLDAG